MHVPFTQDLGQGPLEPVASTSSSAAIANGPRRKQKSKGGSSGTNPGGSKGQQQHNSSSSSDRHKKERGLCERYTDVEAFWRSTPPEKRRELLRVPMASLLQGG